MTPPMNQPSTDLMSIDRTRALKRKWVEPVPSDVMAMEKIHALLAVAATAYGGGAAKWVAQKVARYGIQAVVRYYNTAAGQAVLRAAGGRFGRELGRTLLPL